MDKDTRKLIKSIEAQGFTAQMTSGGHITIRGPDGKRVTTLSGTPSDRRTRANELGYLRRAGYKP